MAGGVLFDIQRLDRRIEQYQRERVRKLRLYAKIQVGNWRRIPYLALQQDGKPGYSGHSGKAYHFGLWGLNWDCIGGFVDCATGNLVDRYLKPLSDRDVGLYATLPMLDTAAIIATYEERIADQRPWLTMAEWERRKKWREEMAKELNLGPLYVRHTQEIAA